MSERKLKIVYQIIERDGYPTLWNRIGIAFENSDGSLNVKLNSLPVNGECHIRDYVPRDERPSYGGNPRRVSPFGPRAPAPNPQPGYFDPTKAFEPSNDDDDIPF